MRSLAGEPLLVHAVRRLVASQSVAQVVVAAPPQARDDVLHLLAPVIAPPALTVVPGGQTRQASVAAALAVVPDDIDIVLVHDAARALVPVELVDRVAAAVRAGHDAVIPVLPVVDTVKRVDAHGYVTGTVDRAPLRAVQTPQGFRHQVLRRAYHEVGESEQGQVTDDAGLVERLGIRVYTVPGSPHAMKITHPSDLQVAESLLTGVAG